VFAFSAAAFTSETKLGDTSVEVVNSSRDIRQFLEKVALDWGKYFNKVVGQYKQDNSLVIRMQANPTYLSAKEILNTGYRISQNTAFLYPLSSARVIILAPEEEKSWRSFEWVIENGQVIECRQH
jgi:hypothetical protein